MIEVSFLIIWTAFFLVIARISWVRIAGHSKIYLIMVYNWIYLTGIFFVYPKLNQVIEHLL